MEARIIGYLEEYSRELRLEFDSLIDRSLNDGDVQAGIEATDVGVKIKDIKAIIARMVQERQNHL